VIFSSIVVPVQQLFSQLFFNGQAVVEACSYAALTSLLAVIRSRCRGCPAAVFHSYPGTERYSCMYVLGRFKLSKTGVIKKIKSLIKK
jgi:hypothetical protein